MAAERKHCADPRLVRRRLVTLIALLTREAEAQSKRHWSEQRKVSTDGLTVDEMREWARQCTNILPAPIADQPTDEELLA